VIRVDSYAALSERLKAFRKRGIISNDFLMFAELRRLADSGELFYDEAAGGLFLYVRREGFYRLYFHIENAGVRLSECAEAISSYVVYKGAPERVQAEWLVSNGFRYENTLVRMCADKLEISASAEGVTEISRDEASAFFAAVFPVMNTDSAPLSSGKCIAVRDSGGSALGVMRYDGKSVRLVAVRAEFRGVGIGSRLFAGFAADTAMLPGAFKLCAVESNFGAIKLYERLGYKPDGLKADLYVRG
jgi:GNAT superfamily N-acetyltransferase